MNGTFRSYFGAIAVPILDKGNGQISCVTHDWANAMGSLGGGLAVTNIRLEVRNKRVDIAKEQLVDEALKNNCEFIIFIDDDTIPPSDALMKMITLWKNDPDKKIISGVYWSKSDPSFPLMFRDNLKGSFWDWKVGDIVKCDSGGAGCLFIDTEIFRKIPKPWFSTEYYFDDPRGKLDLEKNDLIKALGEEMLKGKNAEKGAVKKIEKRLGEIGDEQKRLLEGQLDGKYLMNKKADAGTTEDIYFFKKAKEYGYDLWFDTSIQCLHQDKKTGRIWAIPQDAPQNCPRYSKKMEKDKKIVVDIGAGKGNYWIPEGDPIRIDIDETCKPDIICDARTIPLAECFADVVVSSHTLEYFSHKEVKSVLKEWTRILKNEGTLKIIVPNMKWAASRLLNGTTNEQEADTVMYFMYSAQEGDVKTAYKDVKKCAFTKESLFGLLKSLDIFSEINVETTDGTFGDWSDPDKLHTDDFGYNIIAVAKKNKHKVPVSICIPIKDQEKAMEVIGK